MGSIRLGFELVGLGEGWAMGGEGMKDGGRWKGSIAEDARNGLRHR